jgi:hypothetical protein
VKLPTPLRVEPMRVLEGGTTALRQPCSPSPKTHDLPDTATGTSARLVRQSWRDTRPRAARRVPETRPASSAPSPRTPGTTSPREYSRAAPPIREPRDIATASAPAR